jgi:hypothetical protein
MSYYEFAKQVDVFVLFTLIYLVAILLLADVAAKILTFVFKQYEVIKVKIFGEDEF